MPLSSSSLPSLGGSNELVIASPSFLRAASLFGPNFEPWVLFLLPPGGFISLAMWLLTFTLWREWRDKRKQAREAAQESVVEIAS